MAVLPRPATRLELPPPAQTLSLEALSVVPPGANAAVAQDIRFTLKAGSALAIVGPSGSGKSSLVRAIVGVWPAVHGCVRLDGAAIDQWAPEARGRHIGYLPQDVELFEGTVVQNIARFEQDPSAAAVIAAAQAAGVHDLIVNLPDGYETELGERGTALSAGQQQRIALARALYGEPFLVVLDEPNSNLDSEGEEALTKAILGVRERGGIVIIVAHRPSALAAVDHMLAMVRGRQQAFGPKDELLAKAVKRESNAPAPFKIVPRANG
jgi:ABC-type protease/lipase transport system fused ATPase/permease subunit